MLLQPASRRGRRSRSGWGTPRSNRSAPQIETRGAPSATAASWRGIKQMGYLTYSRNYYRIYGSDACFDPSGNLSACC